MTISTDGDLCLIVSHQPAMWSAMADGLRRAGLRVEFSPCGEQALDALREKGPLVLIAAADIPDMSALELARRMPWINALSHCVVSTAMGHEEFHEAAEGLGVLCTLPPRPTASDADIVLDALAALGALPQAPAQA